MESAAVEFGVLFDQNEVDALAGKAALGGFGSDVAVDDAREVGFGKFFAGAVHGLIITYFGREKEGLVDFWRECGIK